MCGPHTGNGVNVNKPGSWDNSAVPPLTRQRYWYVRFVHMRWGRLSRYSGAIIDCKHRLTCLHYIGVLYQVYL